MCRHFNLLRKRGTTQRSKYKRKYYCLDCGWKLTHKKCGGFKLFVLTKLKPSELRNIGYKRIRKRKVGIWEKTFTETWDLIEPFEEHERKVWKSKNPTLTEARECARMQAYVELAEKLADLAWKPCERHYWDAKEGYSNIFYKSCSTCDPNQNETFVGCFKDHVKKRIRNEMQAFKR